METLKLGFSSCPNDTFMFAALVNGLIACPFSFELTIADVEELNGLVQEGKLDISKVSCHLLKHVSKEYCFLPVGAALGRGCGPLLVTRPELCLNDLPSARIAVPGRYTTAYALLRLYAPKIKEEQITFCLFDQIMPKVQKKELDFGLIIHEGRFVYPQYGLKAVCDLGEWWEKTTGLPIPLGGIVAKRALSEKTISLFTQCLKKSILFAYKHPEMVMPFVRKHACYLEEEVIKKHIALYVNKFSLDLGPEGIKAIETLISKSVDVWMCIIV